MIDLIHDSITSSFGLAYNRSLSKFLLQSGYLEPLSKKQTDFASAYAKSESAGIAALEKLIASFREHIPQ